MAKLVAKTKLALSFANVHLMKAQYGEMSTEKCMAFCSRLEHVVCPSRLTLPAASEKQAQKRKTAIAQNNLQKTRRVPAVRCTSRSILKGLCWAEFWEHGFYSGFQSV
jgi:hypothetical protein